MLTRRRMFRKGILGVVGILAGTASAQPFGTLPDGPDVLLSRWTEQRQIALTIMAGLTSCLPDNCKITMSEFVQLIHDADARIMYVALRWVRFKSQSNEQLFKLTQATMLDQEALIVPKMLIALKEPMMDRIDQPDNYLKHVNTPHIFIDECIKLFEKNTVEI